MQESIRRLFPEKIREVFDTCEMNEEFLEEIRIRIGQPIIFRYGKEELFLHSKEQRLTKEKEGAFVPSREDLEQMLLFLSRYSLYAFEEEIRQGYITLEGGHRVGLAGQVVMEDGKIKNMQYINFMNIRVAREKKGCAKKMIPYLLHESSIFNTLIISPPGMGKTTYLRDAIRILSNGTALMDGMRVCVIDERSEIAACHLGCPQNDVGIRTDVMDGCSKAQGMLMVLRSLSPQVIAVDELGGKEDFDAVEKVVYCGSRILGTVHATSMTELEQKPYLNHWIREKIFERFVFLKRTEGGSRLFEVYDVEGKRLC